MEKYQQYRQHSPDLCNKTAQLTFRCVLYMLFWQQEAGSYRKGVYCRAYEPYVDQD